MADLKSCGMKKCGVQNRNPVKFPSQEVTDDESLCAQSILREETKSFTKWPWRREDTPDRRKDLMSRATEASMARMVPARPKQPAPHSLGLRAQWQSGLETRSGLGQRKLRLSLSPSSVEHGQSTRSKIIGSSVEPNASSDKARVLIVDNNQQFTRSARLFLEYTGHYTVCEVNDPRRALESARSFKPDLALVDLIMPQEDGIEVAAQLEADWALHEVPIVFVTALITPEEANDGRRIEGHRVAAKPVNAFNLLKIIEENLRCCAEA